MSLELWLKHRIPPLFWLVNNKISFSLNFFLLREKLHDIIETERK